MDEYNEIIMPDSVFHILEKKYDKIMRTAHYGDYALGLTSDVKNELNAMYILTFKTENSGILSQCSSCTLKGVKKLASAYYRYKESMVKAEEQISLLNDVFEDNSTNEVSNEPEPLTEDVEIKVNKKKKRK